LSNLGNLDLLELAGEGISQRELYENLELFFISLPSNFLRLHNHNLALQGNKERAMSTQLVTPATLELLQVDLTQVPPEITCDGSDLDWSQAVVIEGSQPQEENLQGWIAFCGLRVNHEAGNVLYWQGQPLRASRARFFVRNVAWRYGFSFSTSIRSPLGKGIPTPPDWRYPGLCRYGLVLFQPNVQLVARQVWESSPEQPQEVDLDPNLDIAFNVNDAKGSYSDNSGSFDIYVQVVS
jgi:hypothetical protein